MPERSYGDMARQMMELTLGGPLATLNYGARGLTGDLLFPYERLTRTREYRKQQQQLPGTDVVPVDTFDQRFGRWQQVPIDAVR